MDIKEYISSGIIESYVLGLASEEEISLMECVRKNHPEVEAAISEAQAVLEDVATIQAIAPAASLKDDIWNKINSDVDLSSKDSSTEQNGDSESEKLTDKIVSFPRSRWSGFSIAAAVLLAVSLGANIYMYRYNQYTQDNLAQMNGQKQDVEQQLASLTARWNLVNTPSVKSVQLLGTEAYADQQAKVFWNTESKAVYLIADGLPKAPEGMQYQLWALVDGQPVDAGTVPLTDEDGMHTMQAIASAQAFAITLEKAGGSPVPTLSQLHVIGNI